MTLEQQVCSLELAKRLKELGVKQESYFWWVKKDLKRTESNEEPWMLWDETARSEFETGKEIDWTSAFTVAELGLLIPKRISMDNGKSYWPCFGWVIDIELTSHAFIWWEAEDEKINHEYFHQRADTEADARAKMLIYLLENKLITL